MIFESVGIKYYNDKGIKIERKKVRKMVDRVIEMEEGKSIYIIENIVRGSKGE